MDMLRKTAKKCQSERYGKYSRNASTTRTGKKPYTDDELTEILKEKGYPIARRTVAKYRQQLNIPVARLRK